MPVYSPMPRRKAQLNSRKNQPSEKSFQETATFEEWDRALTDYINSFPQHPVLSDEAISRESIYCEREDAQL